VAPFLITISGLLLLLNVTTVSFAFSPPMSLRKNKASSGEGASLQQAMQPLSSNKKRDSVILYSKHPLVTSTAIFASMNFAGFIISLITKSHVHLDLIGTGAFAVAALAPLLMGNPAAPVNGRILVSSAAVAVWGTKLASFLFYRALMLQHDARLTATLSTVPGTATFWFISFLWGFLCSLPHTLGTTSKAAGSFPYTVAGSVLFGLGLTMETVADAQKWWFKSNHVGKFCNIGVWSISQHPNFFGNLLLWFGILVINVPALDKKRLAMALLSPLFMGMLFYGQATGAMLRTVEMAKVKYGNQLGYAEYLAETPLIVPNFWKLVFGSASVSSKAS